MPDSLGNLTALTFCNLGGNRLASVPEWLGSLTALTELYLWEGGGHRGQFLAGHLGLDPGSQVALAKIHKIA